MHKSPQTKLQGKCGAWEGWEAVPRESLRVYMQSQEGKTISLSTKVRVSTTLSLTKKVHLFLFACAEWLAGS